MFIYRKIANDESRFRALMRSSLRRDDAGGESFWGKACVDKMGAVVGSDDCVCIGQSGLERHRTAHVHNSFCAVI